MYAAFRQETSVVLPTCSYSFYPLQWSGWKGGYRSPKSAAFLKAYHYVKEYGEGVDRMCRELEVNGSIAPVFHTDDFILKVTVAKVTEKLPENSGKVTEKLPENAEKLPENSNKVTENVGNKLKKVTEKAQLLGDVLTENKLRILHLIIEDPYITKSDLVGTIGINYTSISRNIESMRGKYLRRVGPDKGGFWEIIE